MSDEMRRALEADGEKLRGLTGRDHGPFDLMEFLKQTGSDAVDLEIQARRDRSKRLTEEGTARLEQFRDTDEQTRQMLDDHSPEAT